MITTQLQAGQAAPTFESIAVGGSFGSGSAISLGDLMGQTVVLYFYPKDDTPGCTTQACLLRDQWDDVSERAAVFGISPDSPSSHEKFINKHQLPFPLISDETKKIVQAYDVWVEKSMYGKKYMGVERSTFIISPDGHLHAIFRKVKPSEHLDLVLSVL